MYKNRVKIVVLLLAMVLVDGCAGKRDFTKGVSEEDKKLLSSDKDKVLFKYGTILITQNGFYPYIEGEYNTKVASYLNVKKFNLKKFMDDVNKYNLKDFKKKLLLIKKKFPEIYITKLSRKEVNSFASLSLYDKQKIIVNTNPKYLKKISNPSKELKKIAIGSIAKSCNASEDTYWEGGECRYFIRNSSSISNSSLNSYPSSDNYSGSGGYSGSSSSSSNSNYRPGGGGYYRPGLGHGHSSQY